MNGLALLDTVPFTVLLILYAVALVVVLIGAAVLRWKLRQTAMSGYLFAGILGSLVGLIVMAAPHVYGFLERWSGGLLTGGYSSRWPPVWWPAWLGYPLGPFSSFALGTLLGCMGGCTSLWWFRARRKTERT